MNCAALFSRLCAVQVNETATRDNMAVYNNSAINEFVNGTVVSGFRPGHKWYHLLSLVAAHDFSARVSLNTVLKHRIGPTNVRTNMAGGGRIVLTTYISR